MRGDIGKVAVSYVREKKGCLSLEYFLCPLQSVKVAE